MEEDLIKIEDQITELTKKNLEIPEEKRINMKAILLYVKYFMEHMDDLLINLSDSVNRAAYFGVLFNKIPTYQEIKDGTQKIAQIPGVNELFSLAQGPKVSFWQGLQDDYRTYCGITSFSKEKKDVIKEE